MSKLFKSPFLALLPLFLFQSASAKILLQWDFESENPFHDLAIEGEAPQVVPDPLWPANRVMRAVLKTDSERSERSEVRWDCVKPGQERWVGVKMLLTGTNIHPSICTFQLGPIKYAPAADASSGGYFQLIQQKTEKGQEWKLRGFLEKFGAEAVHQSQGPIPFGIWETWVIHFKVTTGEDGIIEIWRGKKSIYKLVGRNCKEDAYILPVKWGLYIGIGNKIQQNASAYYDNVVLGDERSNLNEITQALAE